MTQRWKVAAIRDVVQKIVWNKTGNHQNNHQNAVYFKRPHIRDNTNHTTSFKSTIKVKYSQISGSKWLRRHPRPTTGAYDWTLYRFTQIIESSTVRQNLRIFKTKKLMTPKLWTVNIILMLTTENYIFSRFMTSKHH